MHDSMSIKYEGVSQRGVEPRTSRSFTTARPTSLRCWGREWDRKAKGGRAQGELSSKWGKAGSAYLQEEVRAYRWENLRLTSINHLEAVGISIGLAHNSLQTGALQAVCCIINDTTRYALAVEVVQTQSSDPGRLQTSAARD